ncbi:MAG: PA domain-containing protein [Lentimonas sp.]
MPKYWIIASVLSLRVAAAASFEFINEDNAGEGLNDPTPTSPVGGNEGVTLGEQRLRVLEQAGLIWGRYLQSSVPIRVAVNFEDLETGILAGAAPIGVEENFSNAPLQGVWYPIALANSLAGTDLQPQTADISVTANSNASFYLGLDDVVPSGQSSFLDVMLHELAHGLGFASLVDESTGSQLAGQPDIFSTLIFDLAFGAYWPELSDSERSYSSENQPNLVWTGPFTTAGLASKLNKEGRSQRIMLQVFSPATIAGTTSFTSFREASFGPRISSGIEGLVVLVDDGSTAPGSASDQQGTTSDACQPILNTNQLAGNIALIRRGGCFFDDKVFRAQEAGAVAVIIANNQDTGLLTPGGDELVDGNPVTISIPSVFITKSHGDALENVSAPIEAAFVSQSINEYTGTQDGFIRLYAPPFVDPGSSVSHWTDVANPNLLMEPFINRGLDRDLDLTLTQMKDIGWDVIDIPFPYLTFESWQEINFGGSTNRTGPTDDFDGDGISNFEEYFFGSDATSSFSGQEALPRLLNNNLSKEISFTRGKLPADLTWSLEISSDLKEFKAAEENVDYEIVSQIALGSETEEARIKILSQEARKFIRIRITSTQ